MNLRLIHAPHPRPICSPLTRVGPRPILLCGCGVRAVMVDERRGPLCTEHWLGVEGMEWLARATQAQGQEDWGL